MDGVEDVSRSGNYEYGDNDYDELIKALLLDYWGRSLDLNFQGNLKQYLDSGLIVRVGDFVWECVEDLPNRRTHIGRYMGLHWDDCSATTIAPNRNRVLIAAREQ